MSAAGLRPIVVGRAVFGGVWRGRGSVEEGPSAQEVLAAGAAEAVQAGGGNLSGLA